MLNMDQLRDYNKWIGKSPRLVLDSAIHADGWAVVFPGLVVFPLWAHRVRNYFSRVPDRLQRMSLRELARSSRSPWEFWSKANPVQGVFNLAGHLALDKYIYRDEEGQLWYQTGPGAAIYHAPGDVGIGPAAKAEWRGRSASPVIKLLSVDGSGGSSELILKNVGGSETLVPEEGHWIVLTHLHVTERRYMASYNYSDTFVEGYLAHKHRDMEPHDRSPQSYLIAPGSRLEHRRFPEFDDNGKPIAP